MRQLILVVSVVATIVSALPAAGQLGPWGPPPYGVPAWIDLNHNGMVDPGETTLYPELVYVPTAPLTEDQLYIRLSGIPAGLGWGNGSDNRINAMPLFNPTQVTRRHVSDPNDRRQTVMTGNGLTFSFAETINPPPPPPGVKTGGSGAFLVAYAITQSASGSAALIDTNADGVYDTLQISGLNGSISIPVTNISLRFKDVNGDGKADYVSIDWLLSGLLGVNLGDPQVWLPLTANMSGKPTTVKVLYPDPRTPGATGGIDTRIQIVSQADGGPGPDPSSIPTFSQTGLLALAATLAASGALLLKGRASV